MDVARREVWIVQPGCFKITAIKIKFQLKHTVFYLVKPSIVPSEYYILREAKLLQNALMVVTDTVDSAMLKA